MADYIDTQGMVYPSEAKLAEKMPTGMLLEIDDEKLRVDVFRDDVLRLKISQGGAFDEKPSCAVCVEAPGPAEFTIEETDEHVVLKTSRVHLRVTKSPFSVDAYRADGSIIFESYRDEEKGPIGYGFVNDRFVVNRRTLSRADAFYGLGEKAGPFNRKGREYVMWTHDIFHTLPEQAHLPPGHPKCDARSTERDPYYMNIPFFYHMPGGAAGASSNPMAGFFVDNAYKSVFDFRSDRYTCQCYGGQYTEYVFAGPSMKEILDGYTWLTGRMEPPPLWALGYHQCRWYRYTEKTFRDLARTYRDKSIPCDVVWLDIDYMDGYRVFTWNGDIFPDPAKLFADLGEQGYRVVAIVDPGVKHDHGYAVFDEGVEKKLFCKAENGQLFTGRVWPGRTVFPDFSKEKTRDWWARHNAEFVKAGIAGIWNDMNEPAIGEADMSEMRFDRDGANHPHGRFHNQYASLMAMATQKGLLKLRPDERPFILSRSGFAGIQRVAANWMGDNHSRWEHLLMGIRMACGLGISGQPFVGADTGGFGESCTPELLARWTQEAALTPFFRNHNADAQDQYPWSFGEAVEELCREAIALRYRLLPYVYSTFMRSCETGEPVQRPLVYDFQSDPATRDLDDEYLFGEALLVAPVYGRGATSRNVYVPKGTWYEWGSDACVVGPCYITADAPMETIPVFARGGYVLPMLAETPQSTKGLEPKSVNLHVFVPQDDGEYVSCLHEDDGHTFAFRRGAYVRTTFTLRRAGAKILLAATVKGEGFGEFRREEFCLIFHGLAAESVKVNGEDKALDRGTLVLANAGEGFEIEAEG
jgi:alpha-glucosidase